MKDIKELIEKQAPTAKEEDKDLEKLAEHDHHLLVFDMQKPRIQWPKGIGR
jgi:hypothetical protein